MGPPLRLAGLIHVRAPLFRRARTRAVIAVLLGWVPLPIFCATKWDGGAGIESFIHDAGVHARFLIAAPVMVLGYAVGASRLGAIAAHFEAGGLLPHAAAPALHQSLNRARRLVHSHVAEIAVFLTAYAIILSLSDMSPDAMGLIGWMVKPDGATLSAAGWWHMLVSLPLLLMLILGWMWRIMIWTWLLSRIARMPLRLIAAHPDQAGGLGFLSQSVRAFSVLGFGMGCIAAGRLANVHLSGAATGFTDFFLMGGIGLLMMVLCVAPLLVFSRVMMRNWRAGSFLYGALATSLGVRFERKWFDGEGERDMLSASDFSAATDLYQTVGNVYAMQFIPVDLRSIAILLGATLVPFLPAMFLSMPADVVLEEIRGMLF